MSCRTLLVPCAIVAALAAAPAVAASSEAPKLIVLELSAAGGIDPTVAGALSESIASEIGTRGYYQVISAREVQTLLGMERQKQLLGCSDDGSACLAELSGALGARFVLSGTLARLGEAYQLTLQTLDTQKAQTLARATRLAKDLSTLRALVPFAVSEATATPPPPAPSKVLQYGLMGAGALAVVAGGILGQSALSQQAALQSELLRGERFPGTLDTFASYERRKEAIDRDKLIALGAVVAGAALIATGVVTLPADPGGAVPHASLVPTANGVALVGIWR
ncbi:MAG: hypothetical protein IRZ16_05080 [Myxococcaceae bacterium]|nr:hypothetical protein [Myxococcaceae bacterium]